MTWKLQAITGELEGQEVTIDRDMLVGRHQDADLLLQAAEISRRHAAFLLKEDALWVQDRSSTRYFSLFACLPAYSGYARPIYGRNMRTSIVREGYEYTLLDS